MRGYNLNTMNSKTITKNPGMIKGIVRGLSIAGREVIKDYNPIATKVYTSNKEFANKYKNAFKDTDVKDSFIVKTGKEAIANIMDEIKTGNFNNKERKDKAMEDSLKAMGMGDVFDDMDDLFDDDDDFGSSSTETETTSPVSGVEITNQKTKNVIVSNTNVKPITKSFADVTKVIIENNTKSFSVVNTGLRNILKFKTTAKLEFFNATHDQFVNMNNALENMSRQMEELTKVEVGGLDVNNTFNQLNSLLDSTELLSIDYYKEKLFNGGKDATKALSPVITVMKEAIKFALPPVFKDAMEETNTMLKALPIALNQKFKEMSETSLGIKGFIGDALYKDTKSMIKYEKGPVPFDGITRRSIVNVIPSLLGKIVNATRGGKKRDELIYDFNAGGFRTYGEVKYAAYGQYNDSISSNSDLKNLEGKILTKMKKDKGNISASDRKKIKKALRTMVENKDIPRKGKKYSTDNKINEYILSSWMDLDPSSKAAFVSSINRIQTPEDFLMENESFHNAMEFMDPSDLFKDDKNKKTFKQAMYEYLMGKGYNNVAQKFKPTNGRLNNNLSKFNPFYYVTEGMRFANDSISKLLFGGDDDIDKNSLFGSIKDKVAGVFAIPLKEHIKNLKKLFKSKDKSESLHDIISESGLKDAATDLFGAVTGFVKDKRDKVKGNIKETIKNKIIDPLVNTLNNYVLKPIKSGFRFIAKGIGRFFTSVTEPIKNAINKRKDRRTELANNADKVENEIQNSIDKDIVMSGSLVEFNRNDNKDMDKMKENESIVSVSNNSNKSSQKNIQENNENEASKYEETIISNNLDLMKTIRLNMNEPISKFSNSVKNVIEAHYKVNNGMDGSDELEGNEAFRTTLYLRSINSNLDLIVKRDLGEQYPIFKKFGRGIATVWDKTIYGFKSLGSKIHELYTKRKERKNGNEELDEASENNDEKGLFRLAMDKVVGKIKNALSPKDDKEIGILGKLHKIGSNITGSLKDIINNISESLVKSSESISGIITTLGETFKEFTTNTLPNVTKSIFENVKKVGGETVTQIKKFGKDVWETVKEEGTKIFGSVKNLFSDSYSKLSDFLTRARERRINVYFEGGYLDGIKNVVKIVKAEKSDYEEMKDKFKEEDEDDRKDKEKNDEQAGKAKGLISGRIKERTERMFNGIKDIAGGLIKDGISSIGSAVGAGASFLLGKAGMSKIKDIAGNVIGKAKGRVKKGKGNIRDIIGKSDATPVYVVGGKLDGVGGSGDSILDDINDLKELGEGKGGKKKLTRRIKDKFKHWKGKGGKIGKIANKLESGLTKGKNLAGRAKDVVKSTEAVNNVKNAIKGTKVAEKGLGLLKGLKGIKNIKNAATAGGAALGLGGAAAAGGSVLATGGTILVPLALAWLGDKAIDSIGGWFKAGELFGTDDPTLGMKVSSVVGSFLDGILPGDQSKWALGIHSTGKKFTNVLKKVGGMWAGGPIGIAKGIGSFLGFGNREKTENAKNGFKAATSKISLDAKERESENPEGKAKSIMSNILQGKSSIITSLLAVTSPMAALTFSQMKKFKSFKEKEKDLESKFLSKLTPGEREEYLSNKDASVFGSLLRSQDGGKLIKTLMSTALIGGGVIGGSALGAKDVIDLVKQALNGFTGNKNDSNGGGVNGMTAVPGADGDFLGKFSVKFETGHDNYEGAQLISSGKGDAGGVSYGIPQFSTTMGSAANFAKWLQQNHPDFGKHFAGLSPNTPAFNTAWKNAYNQNPTEFAALQTDYATKSEVAPFVDKAYAKTRINFWGTRALQETAYSTGVQFGPGGAMEVLNKSGVNANMDEKTIISKYYDEKLRSVGVYKFLGCSGDTRSSVKKRFNEEKQIMLGIAGQPPIQISSYSGPAGAPAPGSSGMQRNTNTPVSHETNWAQSGQTRAMPVSFMAKKSTTKTKQKPVSGKNSLYTSRQQTKYYSAVVDNINSINNGTMSSDPSVHLLGQMTTLLANIVDNTEEAANKDIVKEYNEKTTGNTNKSINPFLGQNPMNTQIDSKIVKVARG